MEKRLIKKLVRGNATTDGAGVHLTRVLDLSTTTDFDPFLMLDSFDSTNPADYLKGFPTHPHRGIETFTYLIDGQMDHQDSMGNRGSIRAGEGQWMSASSGILHEEMPQKSDRMLGFQLWINLPQKNKMDLPAYHTLTSKDFSETTKGEAKVRVLSGTFEGDEGAVSGFSPRYVKATILDIALPTGASIAWPTPPYDTAFVFLLLGEAVIDGQTIPEKTAVLFGEGDTIELTAGSKMPLRFIYYTAPPLKEEIAWGGPLVMNTREELEHAFSELREGTFIKHPIHMDR